MKYTYFMQHSHLSRYITNDGTHQIYLLQGQEVLADILAIKKMTPSSFEAMAQMVCLALLRANHLKGASEVITYSYESTGPIKKAIATADNKGNVKGYIQNPNAEDLSGEAIISATADLGMKKPYHSSVIAIGDSIEEKINYFFKMSDQAELSYLTYFEYDGETVGNILALLYHKLPGDERIPFTFDKEKARKTLINNKDRDLNDIAKAIFKDTPYELASDEDVHFHCDCSKGKFLRLMETLSSEELSDIAAEKEHTAVTCGWCGKEYIIHKDEILGILNRRN